MDTEIRHDRDTIFLALILLGLGVFSIVCCVGGFFWAVFG